MRFKDYDLTLKIAPLHPTKLPLFVLVGSSVAKMKMASQVVAIIIKYELLVLAETVTSSDCFTNLTGAVKRNRTNNQISQSKKKKRLLYSDYEEDSADDTE
jgi:hypothetical protein